MDEALIKEANEVFYKGFYTQNNNASDNFKALNAARIFYENLSTTELEAEFKQTVCLRLGQIYYKLSLYPKAKEVLLNYLSFFPDSSPVNIYQVNFQLALISSNTNLPIDSESYFLRAKQILTDSSELKAKFLPDVYLQLYSMYKKYSSHGDFSQRADEVCTIFNTEFKDHPYCSVIKR